jgi:hypothetical protein
LFLTDLVFQLHPVESVQDFSFREPKRADRRQLTRSDFGSLFCLRPGLRLQPQVLRPSQQSSFLPFFIPARGSDFPATKLRFSIRFPVISAGVRPWFSCVLSRAGSQRQSQFPTPDFWAAGDFICRAGLPPKICISCSCFVRVCWSAPGFIPVATSSRSGIIPARGFV